METVDDYTKVESIFIRHRNALMLRAKFAPIYTDYYLHLMQHGLRNPAELDEILKEFMAMLTLHLVARPWAETIAWTVNLRAPRVNVFVTGGSVQESIVGRVFTEDVREPDRNLFYSQTTSSNLPEPRISTLEVEDKNPLHWIEEYYRQSEQRPARTFRLEDEEYVLIAAQPDCDMAWLESLDTEAVIKILETEETKLLETRKFRFDCGCTLERILPILGNWRHHTDELFGDDEEIQIQCPRCAARYRVTRDMLE